MRTAGEPLREKSRITFRISPTPSGIDRVAIPSWLRIIWDGKKSMMPGMKGKLTKADVDGLVRLIRDFRGGRVQIPEDPELEEEAGIQSKSIVESEPPGSPSSENGPERSSRTPTETADRRLAGRTCRHSRGLSEVLFTMSRSLRGWIAHEGDNPRLA